jgi:HPt (histidine-containing phosphotransfer) domain-containing protein
VSDVSAVDFAFLETYVGGDKAIAAEVLGLFQAQAEGWRVELAAPGADFRDIAHTMKGSALGIGALALGELAARAELDGASYAPAVLEALDAALDQIETYLVGVRT